ncbi:MAG: hypothetical protein JWP36_94, partial [Paucimonas sp.]|nr:hypothetical protein [Paucimonas sp.]
PASEQPGSGEGGLNLPEQPERKEESKEQPQEPQLNFSTDSDKK